MLCDIILNTDTIRLLNNHLQTTSVSQNRKKWERELATDNTRREAQAVQDAAETLHENFVKRAFQTDSICQLATASPHPVLVCGDFNSLPSSYTYHRLSESLKDGFKTGGHGYMYLPLRQTHATHRLCLPLTGAGMHRLLLSQSGFMQ
jgi:endonuclease/exonuclease/phosphatase family metal-dependent hydrolase